MSNELVGIALVGGLLWGGIAFAMLPNAVDSELNSKQASNVNHRYDNQDNQADLDDGVICQVSNGKAYKMVDGLVSNEWVPLTSDGYEYSEQAQTVKQANESLKRIRGSL